MTIPEFLQVAQAVAAITGAFAALIGATLGFLNRTKIAKVETATNGLLAARVAAAHDEGRIAERARAASESVKFAAVTERIVGAAVAEAAAMAPPEKPKP